MKIKYLLFSLILSHIAYSQIGINTEKPRTDLHVNGNLQVTGPIKFGEGANVEGNPGTTGQVLVSQGEGKAPKWQTIGQVIPVPVVNTIARLKNQTSQGSDVTRTIIFDEIPLIDNNRLSYNKTTGEFTVLIAGYYRIYATTLSYADGVTAGDVRTSLKKNSSNLVFAKSTYHHELSRSIEHAISGIESFIVGDKITLEYYRKPEHKITNAYISIVNSNL